MLVSKAVNAASCISSKSDFSKCTCAFCNSFSSRAAVEPTAAPSCWEVGYDSIQFSYVLRGPFRFVFPACFGISPPPKSLAMKSSWWWFSYSDFVVWRQITARLHVSNEPHFDYLRGAKQIMADLKQMYQHEILSKVSQVHRVECSRIGHFGDRHLKFG